ncbi:MAG: AsmA family protein [Verrucomicrobia bacterium]|nr:AsmA family protein [Verrucomicrobiota bacterium]
MAENKSKTKLPEPGRWRRRLVVAVGVIFALLLVTYFVLSSNAFVKGVIVPRVGAALNADLSVSSASVSPFSKVALRDVKLTPKGAETLLTVNSVSARYSLRAILGGRIVVEEVTVISPVISLVEKADGSSNLDPLLKSFASEPKATPPATQPSEPLDVDIKAVNIKGATVRYLRQRQDGQDKVELDNVNLTLADLRNGGKGKLDLSAALALDKTAPEAAAAASVRALLNAGFGFELTQDLMPGSVKGNASFSVGQASGALAELNALAIKLDCDTTPTEVRQLALVFSRAGTSLGQMRLSGPFDAGKVEGKLKLEVLSLDRQVLNLAGAAAGVDFGTTIINATSDLELTKGGKQMAVAGQLKMDRFQLKQANQTTPTLDLRCDYDLSLDQAAESALLKMLNLTGTQEGRPLLQTELTSPMAIRWGSTTDAMGDAALNVTLANLNLADWQAFAADLAPRGMVNARAKLLSQQGGKQLGFELESLVDGFAARLGSNEVSRVSLRALARGSAVDLKQIKLDSGRLDLAQQGQSALLVSGSGTFDTATQDADLQFTAQAVLARLLALMPQPHVTITNGALDFKGRLTGKDGQQIVTGQLALNDFTGRVADNQFAQFGTGADLDLAMKGQQIELRKLAGDVREAQNAGGRFEVTGRFDLETSAGQFALKLTDFNQHGLRPFLESALGDNKLVSVSLNTTASAKLEANGDMAVTSDARLADLVVKDPAGTLPSSPLEASLRVDAGVAKNVAQVRQCLVTLTPTERAKNVLGLTGSVDYSRSNAITGSLKLESESLDVTRYYDLFAGETKPAETKPAPPAAPPTNQEPDAMNLPFDNFTFDARIGRFYLHEVDIANLEATAKLNGSQVLVKPFQLTLNGAPVGATVDLNLGVPGYKYDVAFNAQEVPLSPLVNTFVPDRKGQISGTTTARAQIKGEGITDASLQKNLAGEFNFATTNMNLSIADVRNPIVHLIINVVIGLPELIRNPAASLGNLVTGLRGGGARSGWADQLTSAPIDVMRVNAKAGSGRVNLEQAEVRSAAFQALASGQIMLAPILTNSTIQIPVQVLLRRDMGDKIGLVTADTPTNVTYVAMPQFLTMKGTVGKPDTDISKTALLVLGTKAGGALVKGIGGATGEKVGGALDAVGSLLGGGKPSTDTNQPSATATNPSPGLLDLFRRPKKQ